MNFTDTLFSANHRTRMILRYGWTEAMRVTIDDLLFEATMEAVYKE
jgi:hypothetical protein